jgi:DNA-binding transcriptional LysR family regulator
VTALEKELGVALFERVGRGLELTPTGVGLLEHVRAMGEAANRLSLGASGQSDTLEGSICLTATEVMAAFILPPVLYQLRQAQPGIEIELIASNSTSELKRREADIAIRAFRPTQPDLIVRKVRDGKAHLYASKPYLQQLGNPIKPADFAEADFLGFDRSSRVLDALLERGFPITPRNFPVLTENHLVQWELVKQGLGLGFMPEEIGDTEPAVGRALPNLPPFSFEIWLVAHRELKTSRRVRAVFDFLGAQLVWTPRRKLPARWERAWLPPIFLIHIFLDVGQCICLKCTVLRELNLPLGAPAEVEGDPSTARRADSSTAPMQALARYTRRAGAHSAELEV